MHVLFHDSRNDFMSLTLTFLCISSAGKVEVLSARDGSFNPEWVILTPDRLQFIMNYVFVYRHF